MNRFSRVAITTAIAAAALVGVAQQAAAAELPAGVGCTFPIEFTVTGGNLDVRHQVDVNGQPVRIVSGGSTGTVTVVNQDNDKSISFPSKGVGSTSTTKNGITTLTFSGQLLLIMFPTDVPAGPSTTLYTGRVVITNDENGVSTLQSTAGRKIDVCAQIA